MGWYRHVTLVMLALAFLTVICAQSRAAQDSRSLSSPLGAAPLTVPEVRHLLGHLIWPAVCSVQWVLAWSWWRRCHRCMACYYHTKRRREKG